MLNIDRNRCIGRSLLNAYIVSINSWLFHHWASFEFVILNFKMSSVHAYFIQELWTIKLRKINLDTWLYNNSWIFRFVYKVMNTKQQAWAMAPVTVAFVIMAVLALRTAMDIPGTIVIVRADLQGCIVSFNSFNPLYILRFVKAWLNSCHFTAISIAAKEQRCTVFSICEIFIKPPTQIH